MPSAAAAGRVYTRDRRFLDASSIRGLGECTLRRRRDSAVRLAPVPWLWAMAGLSLSMKGASSSWAFGSTDPSVVPLTVLCSDVRSRAEASACEGHRAWTAPAVCATRCLAFGRRSSTSARCRCHGRLSLLRRAEGLSLGVCAAQRRRGRRVLLLRSARRPTPAAVPSRGAEPTQIAEAAKRHAAQVHRLPLPHMRPGRRLRRLDLAQALS